MKQDIILTVLVVLVVVLSIMRLKNVSTHQGNDKATQFADTNLIDPEWTYRYPFIVSCGRILKPISDIAALVDGNTKKLYPNIGIAPACSFTGAVSSGAMSTMAVTSVTGTVTLYTPITQLTGGAGTLGSTLATSKGFMFVAQTSGTTGSAGDYTLNYASTYTISGGGSFSLYDFKTANVITQRASTAPTSAPTAGRAVNLYVLPPPSYTTNPGRFYFTTDQVDTASTVTGYVNTDGWYTAKSYEDLNRAMWRQPLSEASGPSSNQYSINYSTNSTIANLAPSIAVPSANVCGFFKVLTTASSSSSDPGIGKFQFIYTDVTPTYDQDFLADFTALSGNSNISTYSNVLVVRGGFSLPTGILCVRSFKNPKEDSDPCVYNNQFVSTSTDLTANVTALGTGWNTSSQEAVATCPATPTPCSNAKQNFRLISYSTPVRVDAASAYVCKVPTPLAVPCPCQGGVSTAANFVNLRTGTF